MKMVEAVFIAHRDERCIEVESISLFQLHSLVSICFKCFIGDAKNQISMHFRFAWLHLYQKDGGMITSEPELAIVIHFHKVARPANGLSMVFRFEQFLSFPSIF
jgi:hypothetical protein